MGRNRWGNWAFAGLIGTILVVGPFAYYRWQYYHGKRLRVVTPGVLYRSGQLSWYGLDTAVRRFGIRTIINLRNEDPDPVLKPGVTESDFCRQRGIRYVFLPPDLVDPRDVPEQLPETIDKFFAIMDDPSNYPVLIHCRGGLHRAGVLAALYRIEYEGWPVAKAIAELKENGFGDKKCTSRNCYIRQYLLLHRRRERDFARSPTTAQNRGHRRPQAIGP